LSTDHLRDQDEFSPVIHSTAKCAPVVAKGMGAVASLSFQTVCYLPVEAQACYWPNRNQSGILITNTKIIMLKIKA